MLSSSDHCAVVAYAQGNPHYGSDNDDDDENVRDIYLINVLRIGLPIDAEMREFMANRYTSEFLAQWSAWGAK